MFSPASLVYNTFLTPVDNWNDDPCSSIHCFLFAIGHYVYIPFLPGTLLRRWPCSGAKYYLTTIGAALVLLTAKYATCSYSWASLQDPLGSTSRSSYTIRCTWHSSGWCLPWGYLAARPCQHIQGSWWWRPHTLGSERAQCPQRWISSASGWWLVECWESAGPPRTALLPVAGMWVPFKKKPNLTRTKSSCLKSGKWKHGLGLWQRKGVRTRVCVCACTCVFLCV